MSAVEALKAARAAGIQLAIKGEDLVLEAPAPPSPVVIDLLRRHKTELVALLRPTSMDGRPKIHKTHTKSVPPPSNMTVVHHALGLRRWHVSIQPVRPA